MSSVYTMLSSLFAGVCGYMVAAALLDGRAVEGQARARPAREALMRSPLYRLFVAAAALLINVHPKKDSLAGYFNRARKRLLLAGGPLCLSPEEFLALKELACLCMFVVSLVLGLSATVILILSTAGFLYPDLWLRELYRKRRLAILRELPYVLDLLTLSIEAGLDLTGSMSRVAGKSKEGILRSELLQFLQELKMGKARRQALTDMASRVGVPEITSIVNAIIQCDELGSGLARTLRVQSQEYRTKRFQRAEKLAMEAPVKMTFPLLFIFVSVFLLLFGPFAVQALRGRLF